MQEIILGGGAVALRRSWATTSASVAAVLTSVVLTGCAVDGASTSDGEDSAVVSSVAGRSAETSTRTGTDSDESTTSVEGAGATSEPVATRRPLGMMFTDGGTRFVIDGATGDVPDGFKEKHVRDIYAFLGNNKGDGHIMWLTVVAPMTTKIGPWDEEAARMPGGPSDLPAEPAPADIRGVLDERNVPVTNGESWRSTVSSHRW